MLIGTHVLIYAHDAEKARAFFRDVLQFRHVNAGHGWLIFTLPPAEVGFHPTNGEPQRHVMYLICDDIQRTMADLQTRGVACSPVVEADWGSLTQFEVPGAGTFGVYQPRHMLAIKTPAKTRRRSAGSTAKARPKRRKR
jgi:catechol 2,3-dioxygenase-like lactoylglutathione lyase family enzyme